MGRWNQLDNCSSKLGQGNIRRHQIIPASWWTGGCSWAQAAIPELSRTAHARSGRHAVHSSGTAHETA